jgi:stage V sporulation protein SpoVS
LIDGLRGQTNWRLGKWQGFQSHDFEVILKFKEPIEIKSIGAGFLQDARSWIWMPVYAEFFVSEDGINYVSAGRINNTVADNDLKVTIKDFVVELNKKTKVSYIKVFAKNYGKIPSWHEGAGEDAYIFVDEVLYK